MDLKKHANEVGSALREAHNKKDMARLLSVFDEADRLLNASRIDSKRQREFWSDVRSAAFAGHWLMEKQANNSLVALMQAIQQGLARREGK